MNNLKTKLEQLYHLAYEVDKLLPFNESSNALEEIADEVSNIRQCLDKYIENGSLTGVPEFNTSSNSPLLELSDSLMTEKEYHLYVLAECERQWHECQEDTYGKWEEQSDDTKSDYYNDMYSHHSDLLGKCCCDCAYLAENNNKFTCNCGDSDAYEMEVGRTYCNCFETV